MSSKGTLSVVILSLGIVVAPYRSYVQEPSTVSLIKTVDLPGYTGDFDHFAVDYDRDRLLLAAEDHGSLEVFDLKTSDHVQSIPGFGAPHNILVRRGAPTVLITDSEKEGATLRDADTYAKVGRVNVAAGSDATLYDADSNTIYVVSGGKDVDLKTANLEAVNPDTGERVGKITFNDNHVEAMAFADGDPRLFINLTQTNQLAVVDRKTMKILHLWPVPPARQNAMVSFDSANHRLFVVCRDPGMVVLMDSDTGKVVDTQPAPLRSDQLLYDGDSHRIFVPGGEGFLSIFDTSDPNHLRLIEKVKTAPGAKTGLLLPDMHRLFLVVSPGESKAMAKVLTYEVK